MNKVLNFWHKIQKIVLTVLLALALSALLIVVFTDESPVVAILALLHGSLVGKLNHGTTLVSFSTIMLCGVAFIVATKAGFFNTGLEGDLAVGALAATIVGIYGEGIPAPLLIILCILAGIAAGIIWSMIPTILNVYYQVNMICACYMLNMVAIYLCSFFVLGPLKAPIANPQSYDVAATLPKIMKPSKLSIAFYFMLIIWIFAVWAFDHTTFGQKLKTVGENPHFAKFAGMNPARIGMIAMAISGAVCGFAGSIEIVGNYGNFQEGFVIGLGGKGLLAAMMVKSNPKLLPVSAFLVAMLSSGALYMQQVTGVSKFICDTIAGLFIVIFTMETLFKYDENAAALKLKAKERKNNV